MEINWQTALFGAAILLGITVIGWVRSKFEMHDKRFDALIEQSKNYVTQTEFTRTFADLKGVIEGHEGRASTTRHALNNNIMNLTATVSSLGTKVAVLTDRMEREEVVK